MKDKPKTDVLFSCYDALNTLNDEDKKWVLSALYSRLEGKGQSDVKSMPKSNRPEAKSDVVTTGESNHVEDDGFAEAFSKVNPTTEDKKVLFTAWYLFGRDVLQQFRGFDITKRLKQTGHAVNSVSVCLGRLKAQKPALVVQVGAGGNKKQSRKSYRLTDEGVKAASQMK